MLLSGAALILSVVIGRLAGPSVLGQFTVGYSIAVVCSCLVRSLTVAPFAIYIFRADEEERAAMRGSMAIQSIAVIGTVFTLAMLLIASLAIVSAATVALGFDGKDSLPSKSTLATLMAITLGTTGMMAREVARQASFAEMNFQPAVWMDAASFGFQLAGIAVLVVMERLQTGPIFYILAAGGWLPVIGWWIAYKRQLRIDFKHARETWGDIFRFGRWEALGQSCQVGQMYALPWVMALSGGFAAAGIYAAVWSVLQLVSPFSQAAGNLMGPLLARSYASGGAMELSKLTRRFTILSFNVSAVYVIAMTLLGTRLLTLAYGSRYGEPFALVVVLSVVIASGLATMAVTKSIVVLGRPDWIFAIQAGGVIAILIAAATLGSRFGLLGAAVGLLAAQVFIAIAKVYAYRKVSSRRG